MQALKRHLPKQHIVSTEEFLQTFPEFVVLPSKVWFDTRVRYNPKFTIEDIGYGRYLVKRKRDNK